MTGVQTCALPICFPVTIPRVYQRAFFRTDNKRKEYDGVDWVTHLYTQGIIYQGNYDYSLKSVILNYVLRTFYKEPITKLKQNKGYNVCMSFLKKQLKRLGIVVGNIVQYVKVLKKRF